MRDLPHISIVTVTRNDSAGLTATLQSVLSQLTHPYEHIIVDGSDTDESMQICRQYAEQAPYSVVAIHSEPRGVYEAINRGISAATGELIGLLHGADRYTSERVLRFISEQYSSHPGTGIFYGDVVYSTPTGKYTRYYSGADFSTASLKWGFLFPHPSMYVHRSIYERYGLYNTDYSNAADFEWLVRTLLKNGENALYLPVCVVNMSTGGQSAKWRHRVSKNITEKLRALRTNGYRLCPLRMIGRYRHAITALWLPRYLNIE